MKNKRDLGITLIALVITIIILLILAGVSIAVLTGENGIIERAKESVNAHSKAAAIEDVKLAWQEIRTEYETREDKNKVKTDYYTKEKVSNALISGTIADEDGSFIYNESGKSLVVYENNKKEKYKIQIDEFGNIMIIEQNDITMEDVIVTTTYSANIRVGEKYTITTSEPLKWEISSEDVVSLEVNNEQVDIEGLKVGSTILRGRNYNNKLVNECIIEVAPVNIEVVDELVSSTYSTKLIVRRNLYY